MPRHALPRWPAVHPSALNGGHDEAPLDPLTTHWVREMLACRGGSGANRIDVEVRGGTAVLTGTVDSARDAEEALRLAISVRGVRRVQNHLQVRHPPTGLTPPVRA